MREVRSDGGRRAAGRRASRADRRRTACPVHEFLMGRGRPAPAEMLGEIGSLGDELEGDMYGGGWRGDRARTRVQELLGKPAAVFMPSGTMAQQIALRIHADRTGRRVVRVPPDVPPRAARGQGLSAAARAGRSAGRRCARAPDGRGPGGSREPLAAVVFELPQREIGGLLPSWEDLVAQVAWPCATRCAVHLDGARLWECTTFYGRDLHEIAALFDSVYVSFYKGLGGICRLLLAGDESLVAEAREWRTGTAARCSRCGRTPPPGWRAAAGPRGCRRTSSTAKAIAADLHQVDGVEAPPRPAADADDARLPARRGRPAGRRRSAGSRSSAACGPGRRPSPPRLPGWRVVELLGAATRRWSSRRARCGRWWLRSWRGEAAGGDGRGGAGP